jgi:hypothetical protein
MQQALRWLAFTPEEQAVLRHPGFWVSQCWAICLASVRGALLVMAGVPLMYFWILATATMADADSATIVLSDLTLGDLFAGPLSLPGLYRCRASIFAGPLMEVSVILTLTAICMGLVLFGPRFLGLRNVLAEEVEQRRQAQGHGTL